LLLSSYNTDSNVLENRQQELS